MRGIALHGIPETLARALEEPRQERPEHTDRHHILAELLEQGWQIVPNEHRMEVCYWDLRGLTSVMAEYRRKCGATRRVVVRWPPEPTLRVPVATGSSAAWIGTPENFEPFTYGVLGFSLRRCERVRLPSGKPGPYLVVYEED